MIQKGLQGRSRLKDFETNLSLPKGKYGMGGMNWVLGLTYKNYYI